MDVSSKLVRLEERVNLICKSIDDIQGQLRLAPSSMEDCVTKLGSSIRDEIRPLREAIIGNGHADRSILHRLASAEEFLDTLRNSGCPSTGASASTTIKIILAVGVPVIVGLVVALLTQVL